VCYSRNIKTMFVAICNSGAIKYETGWFLKSPEHSLSVIYYRLYTFFLQAPGMGLYKAASMKRISDDGGIIVSVNSRDYNFVSKASC